MSSSLELKSETYELNLSQSPTARRVHNLAKELAAQIDNFHRRGATDMSGLAEVEKRNEYFEVVRKGQPNLIVRLAKPVSWSVIWRSARRPSYFAAMLTDLYWQAHETYGKLAAPAYVSFHIYRSQYDFTHNIAVALVHWLDDRHPGYEAAA